MKLILLLLLIPFFAPGQTVHIKDGKVEYKETVKLKDIPKATLHERAKEALLHFVTGNSDGINIDNNETGTRLPARAGTDGNDARPTDSSGRAVGQALETKGKIRLSSPYSIIRFVHYTITINIDDGEYKYKIDSVYIKQKERGGKTKAIPSEDLVKDIEVSGIVAIGAEKQLNEIDMEFQKLISLINTSMKKAGN